MTTDTDFDEVMVFRRYDCEWRSYDIPGLELCDEEFHQVFNPWDDDIDRMEIRVRNTDPGVKGMWIRIRLDEEYEDYEAEWQGGCTGGELQHCASDALQDVDFPREIWCLVVAQFSGGEKIL